MFLPRIPDCGAAEVSADFSRHFLPSSDQMSHAARRCASPFTAIATASTGALLLVVAPRPAPADIVTGRVTPANAKVTLLNAAGETVAELAAGPYQVQLPVGRYKARCDAPKEKTMDVLVLSEPVTVNIDCN